MTSIVGAVAGEFEEQRCIVPAWKRGLSNTIVNSGSGDYNGGDRVLSNRGYFVDGDLLITCGWGDGVAIRRLNNDGTMTLLYSKVDALYRDTTSTYANIHSLAGHAPSSQVIVMSHNVDGYSIIDYSDLKTGGSTVVNTRPASQYVFSNGVNVDRAGIPYTNGLVTAGDWLYIGDHDATHYKNFPRRNFVTEAQELIDGTSASYIYSGAATISRNGYQYSLFYDEVNDRVFYCSYYNGNFMMIVDASTANPKCVWCDMEAIGLSHHAQEQGLFIPDAVNYPNKITVGCNGRHAYIDITNCYSGGNATIIKQFYTEGNPDGSRFANYFRAGTNFQGFSEDAYDKHPSYPDFHITTSDRGRNHLDGWIDYDNNIIVGVYKSNTDTTEDTITGGRGRSYMSDYSSPLFRMTSANGTGYWIKTGYGYDGHSFKIWPDSVGPGLIGNWTVEYGSFSLDNSENIGFVNVTVADHYIPSGCSINYFVSNNNGSSWEAYSIDEMHYFSSEGNSLRVKYVTNGFENKAPYKMSTTKDIIIYGNIYEGIKQDLPIKISKFKIRGRER